MVHRLGTILIVYQLPVYQPSSGCLTLRDTWSLVVSALICDSTGKIAEIVDRPLQRDDLVLRVIRGLIRDPMGKFRPNWSGPYFIRELTPEGAAWLMDLDGNRFSEPTNVDQLKRHSQVHGSWGSLYMLHFIYEGMSFDHWVFEPSFLSFLSPYHLGLRYVPRLKTTLRPWDQMSSSAASTWTVVFGLPGSFMDPHGLARSSLTGCSSRRGHDRLPYGASKIHPAGSALLDTWIPSYLSTWEVTCAMMDDFMTFVLRTCRAPDAIRGHIPFQRIFMDLRRGAYFGSDEIYRS
ncbi:hypothetical protein CK203_079628 [Vitis vinifera]|uniref:Uncharacterized protein n=1 Tax=Vitis vinifera TaxID=29760 RepID=A0A438DL23_VITVI|nr:hypothetical protein CK203_079628 [Vitis vinifera]